MSARYRTLDALRGLCVISMVLYHALYDLVAVKGWPVSWYWKAPGQLWQLSICCTFIALSGACWNLSQRRLRRGLLLVGCGFLITLVTALAMPGQVIWFGILVLLGASGLLAEGCRRLGARLGWGLPAGVGLTLCLGLFLFTWGVPQGFVGLGGLRWAALPAGWYQVPGLAVLGFPGPGFTSSDYFPLLPWFFLYAAGIFAGRLIFPRPGAQALLRGEPLQRHGPGRGLQFIGRHSLLIYLLHQPVLMLLFLAVPNA